ncbi:MAG TPA: hypothetical protein VFN66_08225 [Burkholderiales bacterium]|nr:hypothetical protein [Burkholderiales bacterium]
MTIQLLIPDLIPAAEMTTSLLGDLQLPSLSGLLARGSRNEVFDAGNPEAALCKYFGIQRQIDWPIAPLTLLADGGEPGKHYWLRADPVHLRATREQLMLVDSGAFNLDQNEAEQFAQAFNLHFQAEDYTLYPLHPKRWYMKLPLPPQITTFPVNAVTGRHIDACLPKGADALDWHRFYNEIQMLFFSLPVNDQRESRGELAVNSLWCWGGGTMPLGLERSDDGTLWANDSDARALAAATGSLFAHLPANAGSIDSPGLVYLDGLSGAAQYADYQGWREALLELEKNWFQPLLAQLKSGKLSSLGITTFARGHTVNWKTGRADLYKLWRRAGITQSLTPPPNE